MPGYAAFLRGVSPLNAKMSELKRCFEAAGFTDVTTVRSSGNVVFRTRKADVAALERKCEAAMKRHLGRVFFTIVRPLARLQEILDADPYQDFALPAGSKRVITLLRDPPRAKLDLPIEFEGARILCVKGQEIFSAYVPHPRAPVFMTLIEKTFGAAVTTRTWETLAKVAGCSLPH